LWVGIVLGGGGGREEIMMMIIYWYKGAPKGLSKSDICVYHRLHILREEFAYESEGTNHKKDKQKERWPIQVVVNESCVGY